MTPGARELRKTPPEKVTVARWLMHYREFFPDERGPTTIDHDREMVRQFVRRYGPRPIASITPMEAQAWALKHPSQVRWLRHAWVKATLMQIVPLNIWRLVEMPKREKPKRIPPTLEQLDAMLADCRGRGGWWLEFADLIEVAAFTGLRRGGIVSLRRANVDLRHNRLTVTEKGKRTRTVVVVGRGKDALASTLGRHPWTSFVFALHNPLRPIPENVATDKFRVVRGDFEGSFHSLRHFHASWLASQGVSSKDIAVQLGHTDAQGRPYVRHVDRVYTHPDPVQVLARIEETIS